MRLWKTPRQVITLGSQPLIMGIVNITPDSFSDGGQWFDVNQAVEHACQLEADGAHLIDLGGESSRPGADPISVNEELKRVIPVVERLAEHLSVPISIDTTKSQVAREALQAGAAIINDISGLQFDAEMVDVCCEFQAGVVCMHMQGTPKTMQVNPQYSNVVQEICEFFRQREEILIREGLALEQLVWDPGVGFGKSAFHNVQILSSIATFHELGRPILIGHSRKRFLQKVVERPVDERLFGTLGVSLALVAQGADIIRVHDVAAHRDAITAYHTILNPQAFQERTG